MNYCRCQNRLFKKTRLGHLPFPGKIRSRKLLSFLGELDFLDWGYRFNSAPTCAFVANFSFGSWSFRPSRLHWFFWSLESLLVLRFPRERFRFCSQLCGGQWLCRPFCWPRTCQCHCHSYRRYHRCGCSVLFLGFLLMSGSLRKGSVIPVIAEVQRF